MPIRTCTPFFHLFTVFENPIKGFVHKNFNDLCGEALEKDGKAAKKCKIKNCK
jgi:hypothetical protein